MNQNMLVTLCKNESNNNSLFAVTPLQVLAIQRKMNSKGTHYKVQDHKTMNKIKIAYKKVLCPLK